MGAFIGIGALIDKNTFEGWVALIGRIALNRIITVSVNAKGMEESAWRAHTFFQSLREKKKTATVSASRPWDSLN